MILPTKEGITTVLKVISAPSLVIKITLAVNEITFLGADIRLLVAKITFVAAEINFKEAVITSSVANWYYFVVT